MDVLGSDLYYIAMTNNARTLDQLSSQGFTQPTWFRAVDARKWDDLTTRALVDTGQLSLNGYMDVRRRKFQRNVQMLPSKASKGAIGCFLSHMECWRKCRKGSHIVVVEEDVRFTDSFSPCVVERAFAAADRNFVFRCTLGRPFAFGTHFYVADFEACQQLLKHALPVEMHVDAYMSMMAESGFVVMHDDHYMVRQHTHASSIQQFDPRTLTTWYPLNVVLAGIVLVTLLVAFLRHKRSLEAGCRERVKYCENGRQTTGGVFAKQPHLNPS
jgi:GR25 family glycosyltransferase involved in LPS biosynthesis